MKKARAAATASNAAAARTGAAALLFGLAVAGAPRSVGSAGVPCDDTQTCETLLRPGSVCGPDGTCTNPFSRGCLRAVLGEDYTDVHAALPLRACNSNDSPGPLPSSQCSVSDFDYPEVRISNGNWETTFFTSWMLQILLSELLGVPAAIETGTESGTGSFYDPRFDYTYGQVAYNWAGLYEASRVPSGDCRLASTDADGERRSCHHVIPEVWSGQSADAAAAFDAGAIGPMSSLDVIGRMGIFVPWFAVERDPSIANIMGIGGERNRRKLAETFLRPTTWADYCGEVSEMGCESDDGVAARAPSDETEGGAFFKEGGAYTGHFRATERNNCTANPNCTGHFVGAPCGWSTFAEGQFYWNDVAMEYSAEGIRSNPEGTPYRSYSYASMREIWFAANATKSSVMMMWFRPDELQQKFSGTPGEMVPVSFVEPTMECVRSRISSEERCSPDPAVRRGFREGSCDYEPSTLKKAISSTLERAQRSVPEARRSAAHDALEAFRTTDLVLDYLLREWQNLGVDKYGYDPREVVCSWFADNVDEIKSLLPETYPRKIREESDYEQWYLWAALALGACTISVTLFTVYLTYHWRKTKIVEYAQPHFLMLILFGFLLVGGAAVVYAVEPRQVSCVLRQWLVLLGYSLELIPLIVKMSAINKVIASSNHFRRVKLSKPRLLRLVAILVVLVAVYLSVWTALDPPKRQEEYVLTGDTTEGGGTYVTVQVQCASKSDAWYIVALVWQLILLLYATVLAFQSRNIRQEFNESQRLAFMIYSHFIFVLVRLVMLIMADSISATAFAAATSLILSVDTLLTLTIYFAPKFHTAWREGEVCVESQHRGGGDGSTELSSVEQIRRRIATKKAEQMKKAIEISIERRTMRAPPCSSTTVRQLKMSISNKMKAQRMTKGASLADTGRRESSPGLLERGTSSTQEDSDRTGSASRNGSSVTFAEDSVRKRSVLSSEQGE